MILAAATLNFSDSRLLDTEVSSHQRPLGLAGFDCVKNGIPLVFSVGAILLVKARDGPSPGPIA